jgi:hypothetical protein
MLSLPSQFICSQQNLGVQPPSGQKLFTLSSYVYPFVHGKSEHFFSFLSQHSSSRQIFSWHETFAKVLFLSQPLDLNAPQMLPLHAAVLLQHVSVLQPIFLHVV